MSWIHFTVRESWRLKYRLGHFGGQHARKGRNQMLFKIFEKARTAGTSRADL